MAEEVLRLRTTVVANEALSELRKVETALGRLPPAGRGIQQINASWMQFGRTVSGVNKELVASAATMGRLFGSFIGGVSANAMLRGFNDITKRMVELKYASKELGLSERDIRAWMRTAERAGVSGQAFVQGLQKFSDISNGLRYNIGGVRNELIRMGAGPVVRQIMVATDQAERLRIAFQMKDTLMREDPSGFKARQWFEQLGLGQDAARLSLEQYEKQQARTERRTKEQIEQGEKAREVILDLADAWEELTTKFSVGVAPELMKDMKALMQDVETISKWIQGGKIFGKDDQGRVGIPGMITVDPNAPVPKTLIQPPGEGGGMKLPPSMGRRRGYRPSAYGGDEGVWSDITPGGGGDQSPVGVVEEGVYRGLVRFASGGQSGGGGGGLMNAAYTPGGGFGGGGGGMAGLGGLPGFGGGGGGGGGSLSGGAPGGVGQGTGMVDQSTSQSDQTSLGGLPGPSAAGVPGGSRGGSAGITAPAGTAIARSGLATVTAASGRKFQVDARFAQNFQGFIRDYENAGGQLGPDTGTLGSRPRNASGHPIGAAIDINQIGYGIRSKAGRGTTLPVATENQLAEKWGLVSGANWRKPDTGHFGIKSVEAARQALIAQGMSPSQATELAKDQAGAAAKAAGQTDGKTVKGSVFGSTHGWRDPSEPTSRPTASGRMNVTPGIALPQRFSESGKKIRPSGEMYEVTTPDGRTFTLPHIDTGPAAWTGRGIDINSAAAAQMGYKPGTFPTDKPFTYRPAGAANAVADRKAIDGANGQQTSAPPRSAVNLNVNSNGTKADVKTEREGPQFAEPQVKQSRQMQPTEDAGAMHGP